MTLQGCGANASSRSLAQGTSASPVSLVLEVSGTQPLARFWRVGVFPSTFTLIFSLYREVVLGACDRVGYHAWTFRLPPRRGASQLGGTLALLGRLSDHHVVCNIVTGASWATLVVDHDRVRSGTPL